jgi:hypothetical protein
MRFQPQVAAALGLRYKWRAFSSEWIDAMAKVTVY